MMLPLSTETTLILRSVGFEKDIQDDGSSRGSGARRVNVGLVMSAFGTKRTSKHLRSMSAFGVKRTLTRDTIGIGFLSGYAPRADTNQQISIPRNVTDVIFELAAARAFDGRKERPPCGSTSF